MSKQLKIALFGATGMIGSRIAAEAARRGHQVTALARNPARVPADVRQSESGAGRPARRRECRRGSARS